MVPANHHHSCVATPASVQGYSIAPSGTDSSLSVSITTIEGSSVEVSCEAQPHVTFTAPVQSTHEVENVVPFVMSQTVGITLHGEIPTNTSDADKVEKQYYKTH